MKELIMDGMIKGASMKRFTIEFKHTVEESYTAIIDAETEDEALELFDDDPFSYLIDGEPDDVQGLRIDITNVEGEDL
jgi:hypothetical protein